MASPAPGPIPTLRGLLDRAARATLHRLAGGRNLLYGWASLGAPAAHRAAVEARCREDRELLARLDWLREAGLGRDPDLLALVGGDRALCLLAAALGVESPAASAPLASAGLGGEQALAAACWVVLMGAESTPWCLAGGSLRLGPVAAGRPLPPWWTARFGPLPGLQLAAGVLVIELGRPALGCAEA